LGHFTLEPVECTFSWAADMLVDIVDNCLIASMSNGSGHTGTLAVVTAGGNYCG